MKTTDSVEDYLDSLNDDQTIKESQILIRLMKKISDHDPKLWNIGTIGFDSYHYKYESGREGNSHILGFYPRKGKITVYLMDGTTRYSELLDKLGKHNIKDYCLYIKHLSDIDIQILEKILKKSYENIKSQDGNITQILWKIK